MTHSRTSIVGTTLWLLASSILLLSSPLLPAGLVISEFMAANRTFPLDEDGEASDWVELHNPTSQRINLAGWSLTDDAKITKKWLFPERFIEPGDFLVVFASAKNRTGPGALHTNFRLDAAGEYLGLFQPGQNIAASEFSPRFPPQEAGISFGIPMTNSTRDLLDNSAIWLLLPGSPAELPDHWTAPGLDHGSGWSMAKGFAIGFDATPAGAEPGANLALKGVASQSTTGYGLGAANAIDGNPSSFTHTASDDNASSWSLDLGALFEIRRVVLRNRQDCCATRFRDLTVSLLAPDGTVAWTSELLNPENILGSPESLTLDLFDLNVGAVEARTVQVVRTPDPDLSGSGGAGNDDEDNVLSLGEVEVYGVGSISYGPLIRTDLTDGMKGKTSSAFVRVPFVLENPEEIISLTLQLRYDDGLAVWLNSERLAALNAPTPLTWSSAALVKREKNAALKAESLDLLPFRSLWRAGTNWIAIQGLNAAIDDPEFLLDVQLLAGTPAPGEGVFFQRPTPGASNDVEWDLGRVADTKLSVNRGIAHAPFELVITSATPGAEVLYTLDGSLPTQSQGIGYSGPIRIERSTVVRAAAFKPGYRATGVNTHTYIFLADVVSQPALPPGFPASWAGVPADYAMDPRITRAAAYASRMNDSLQSLPSLALTTPAENLFGSSRGIYANPERSGVDWERPVSLEWIGADGAGEFQINCGLRIQGGHFRQRNVTRKHSLRLLFKSIYGPRRLNRDIFRENGAAREFDTLVLRAGANDGYSWNDARDTEQFLRDEFGRRTLLAMGQPSARGQFVHLYLNGLYWGLYNLTERPAEDFSSSYLGGKPDEWDAINSGEVKSGTLEAWHAFIGAVRTVATIADYQRLKGLDAEGVRHPGFPELFDAANYIDYMLLNIWGGNWDWPGKNFWFGRHRAGLAGGFKFYLWDFENTMGNNRDRSPLHMVAPRPGEAARWVGEPHDRLKRFAEYQIEFADRVQRHFFNQGTLSPEALIGRYQELAARVQPAVIAETARWGDDNWPVPQDLTDWQRERDWILNTYLPQRTGIVLGQLRSAGLFPQVSAPDITPPGGSVTRATPILLTSTAAELFYTTNGFDPRLTGGGVHPNALRAALAGNSDLIRISIPAPAIVKARARQGSEWSALTEARFTTDLPAASSQHLVVSEFCYRPPAPVTMPELAVTSDRDEFEFVELMNTSAEAVDLAGVRFTAGILFTFQNGTALEPGQRILVVRNRAAFAARYGAAGNIAGEYQGNLSNSGEQIALDDAAGQEIRRFFYLDRAPWPASAEHGYSLVLQRPGELPDHNDPEEWRASVRPGGFPGGTDTLVFQGSPAADLNGNGQADLFDYAFGALLSDPDEGIRIGIEPAEADGTTTEHLVITIPRNLAADAARVTLEAAEDLAGPWRKEPGDFMLIREQRSGAGLVRLSFRMSAAVAKAEWASFIRISVTLAP
jgi:hypothetical protein